MSLSPAQGSAEFGVLCSVARVKPNYNQIATAVKGNIDWTVLLSLAAAHSVRPQLISAFQKLDWIGTPAETKRSLSDFLLLHKARCLLVASELIRVSDEFSQRAIPFATFKGPSLAAGLYGDLSLRECNDIDLIVDQQQVVRAEAVLGSLGYRSDLGSSGFRSAFLSYQKQFLFVQRVIRASRSICTGILLPLPFRFRSLRQRFGAIWSRWILEVGWCLRLAAPTSLYCSQAMGQRRAGGVSAGWQTLQCLSKSILISIGAIFSTALGQEDAVDRCW